MNIKGVVFVLISAFIFGFTPILGKLSYAGGSNAIMLTFLRSFLVIPILYLLLQKNKIPLSLNKKEKRDILVLSIFGSSLTTVSLYASYNYISVGLATTLHFLYPCLVFLFTILFMKTKVNKIQILALVVATIGVMLFCDFSGQGSVIGLVLSLLSAFSWAFYVIYQDFAQLTHLHPLKFCFYQACFVSLV